MTRSALRHRHDIASCAMARIGNTSIMGGRTAVGPCAFNARQHAVSAISRTGRAGTGCESMRRRDSVRESARAETFRIGATGANRINNRTRMKPRFTGIEVGCGHAERDTKFLESLHFQDARQKRIMRSFEAKPQRERSNGRSC